MLQHSLSKNRAVIAKPLYTWQLWPTPLPWQHLRTEDLSLAKLYSLNVKEWNGTLHKSGSVKTNLSENHSPNKWKLFQSEWKLLQKQWKSLKENEFHFFRKLTAEQLFCFELIPLWALQKPFWSDFHSFWRVIYTHFGMIFTHFESDFHSVGRFFLCFHSFQE